MKIAYVGHTAHNKTLSNEFFTNILKDIGEVRYFSYSPDHDGDGAIDVLTAQILDGQYDKVIFWQTEEVAKSVVPALDQRRVILVPMWDGAVTRDGNFWHQFQGLRFISFSRKLHETLLICGLRSSYFQYFSEPAPELDQNIAAGERTAFFWERRPSEALNLSVVYEQCSLLQVEKLYLHAVPDFTQDMAQQRLRILQLNGESIPIFVSGWMEDKSEKEALVSGKTFYFAPRSIEGIGMGVVEALARGQIVVSPDNSTMNEYIGHLSSGILYEPKRPFDIPRLTKSEIKKLSEGAYAHARFGYERWLKDIERLKSMIRSDQRRWLATDYGAHFSNQVAKRAHDRLRSG